MQIIRPGSSSRHSHSWVKLPRPRHIRRARSGSGQYCAPISATPVDTCSSRHYGKVRSGSCKHGILAKWTMTVCCTRAQSNASSTYHVSDMRLEVHHRAAGRNPGKRPRIRRMRETASLSASLTSAAEGKDDLNLPSPHACGTLREHWHTCGRRLDDVSRRTNRQALLAMNFHMIIVVTLTSSGLTNSFFKYLGLLEMKYLIRTQRMPRCS